MAVGASDYIDKLLVQKYANQKVDNHEEDALVSKICAEDMMTAMNTYADNSRQMLLLKNRLTIACYGAVAQAAKYESSVDAA